jgi:hypothetical protein
MGRDWGSRLTAGESCSLPFFKALMIAALAELVVGSVTITGVFGEFFDMSNEMECAEYLLDSRAYGRIFIGPSSWASIDPFRAFSVSRRPKSKEVGESLSARATGSFVKKEAGNPLELKADSTLTIVKHGQSFMSWDGRGWEKAYRSDPNLSQSVTGRQRPESRLRPRTSSLQPKRRRRTAKS